jgi:NAD(P)-dependent dehydrogenase (short-subunit alcohol dehydrogenase family)
MRVFITGSADGLGQMAARLLVADGHQVVLHGRSAERAQQALESVPGAEAAVYGDLSSIEAMLPHRSMTLAASIRLSTMLALVIASVNASGLSMVCHMYSLSIRWRRMFLPH